MKRLGQKQCAIVFLLTFIVTACFADNTYLTASGRPVSLGAGIMLSVPVGSGDTYWTDTNSHEGLWEMETSNTTQTLDTGGDAGGPYNASNMPSVATGPAWYETGTNQYGRVEHGYSFAGIDDRFFLDPSALPAVTNGTVGCWFFITNAITSFMGLVTKDASGINDGDASLYLYDNGANDNIAFSMSDASTLYSVYNNGTTIPTNAWTHVAVTFGSGGMKMYVNGIVQTDTDAFTGGWTRTVNRWCFGDNGLGTRYLKGQMDQPFISRTQWSSNAIYTFVQYNNPTNQLRARPSP